MSRPSRRELGAIFRRAMHDLGDDIGWLALHADC